MVGSDNYYNISTYGRPIGAINIKCTLSHVNHRRRRIYKPSIYWPKQRRIEMDIGQWVRWDTHGWITHKVMETFVTCARLHALISIINAAIRERAKKIETPYSHRHRYRHSLPIYLEMHTVPTACKVIAWPRTETWCLLLFFSRLRFIHLPDHSIYFGDNGKQQRVRKKRIKIKCIYEKSIGIARTIR